ncbi:maker595 [Drosophila busckii]|uniref:Maker595 n=1 Tax=Drosophila busckii TaxID=30019 RepID=A0A0M4EE11_DROBS|nr:maker595 [Drosophila busckii]
MRVIIYTLRSDSNYNCHLTLATTDEQCGSYSYSCAALRCSALLWGGEGERPGYGLQCLLDESAGDCSKYCYKVVHHLLQYFHVASAKQNQFETLQIKIHEQDALYTKNLEAGVELQQATHRKNEQLEAKIHELQLIIKTLKEQQTALEQNDAVNNSLMKEKDKRIAELKQNDEAKNSVISAKDKLIDVLKQNDAVKDKRNGDLTQQILNSVDVRQLNKLFKYVDRAEATSCLPFDNSNDIQTIRVPGIESFRVPCDSTFAGSGWTVVQRRQDGSVNFKRNWDQYKNGFGDLRNEFWLGLEKVHLMTKFQSHELFVQLEDFNHETRYARYSNFSIASESRSYELLTVGAYSGNAGNALDTNSQYDHKNMKFATPDRDNQYKCAGTYDSVESDGDCTRYCYKVVQQLLQYFRVSSAKLDQFETLQAKIHEQELYIKKLEATPKVQEETLEKIQELQTKIDEQQILTKTVQTKLDEQQAALKQNVKNSIINEKDNLIADLKQQILDSVDVRQLTKYLALSPFEFPVIQHLLAAVGPLFNVVKTAQWISIEPGMSIRTALETCAVNFGSDSKNCIS